MVDLGALPGALKSQKQLHLLFSYKQIACDTDEGRLWPLEGQ